MKLQGKTTQFFTSKTEYNKAKGAGINMNDSHFVVVSKTGEIITRDDMMSESRTYGEEFTEGTDYYPVYTLSEILYKLPEWVSDKPYNGPIKYLKDAPFYGFCLYTPTDKPDTRTQEDIDARIECMEEYPIRSAMEMLIECAKRPNLWYVEDVSDK